MNKRLLVWVLILVLLMAFILISCQSNSLEKEYRLNAYTSSSQSDHKEETEETEAKTMVSAQNEKAIGQIKNAVDIHYVIEKYFTKEVFGLGTLYDISTDIGIECLRETDAGALYSVHKVKQGGLLYIFYLRSPDSDYIKIIRWFFVQKKLSYSDFSSIKDGTTINQVMDIDPTAQIFLNIYNTNPEYWDKTGGFGSWHYLSDGILEIGYKYEDGTLRVFDQKFIDDFEVRQNASRVYPYDGHILPIDMIQ